eukprot:1257755-Alexandrium_andersonii.AAC.1
MTCSARQSSCEVSCWKVSSQRVGKRASCTPGAVSGYALPGPEGKEGTTRGQQVSLAVRAAARAGVE